MKNGMYSKWCKKCEKEYCNRCVTLTECDGCNELACNNCEEMKACGGDDCGEVMCEDCYEKNTCSYCEKTRCGRCKHDDCPNAICHDCEMNWDFGMMSPNGRCQTCNLF